jgi:hypothetical protein
MIAHSGEVDIQSSATHSAHPLGHGIDGCMSQRDEGLRMYLRAWWEGYLRTLVLRLTICYL